MPDIPDSFSSIKRFNRSQLRVKGSKFIAYAFPVENEEEVQDLIGKVKKEFHDATHHCFAYRIKLKDKDIIRTSDAGEPKGTAGEPIFLAIKSKDLYNVLVVVTRYFGGTKLGKGGLARAYKESAKDVLYKCEIIEKLISEKMSFHFPISLMGRISQILDKFNCKILEKDFSAKGFSKIEIRKGQVDKLKKTLVEATRGKIRFED